MIEKQDTASGTETLEQPGDGNRKVHALVSPWDDCKVAFGVDGDVDELWDADLNLPDGWELNETDSSGFRLVAVFRVAGVPTVKDGERVEDALRKFERG